ncbi:hypothetical protein [Leifsonia soli]|uniref:Uncharacterized protein n=1 Tax=Leifsonia soli TaxID=582665 RepID=A0A852T654_9MICO|nr:hypothetical protein [Leifsonia soli]NYD76014.1 hypothetical protein [Leifsonia soli]
MDKHETLTSASFDEVVARYHRERVTAAHTAAATLLRWVVDSVEGVDAIILGKELDDDNERTLFAAKAYGVPLTLKSLPGFGKMYDIVDREFGWLTATFEYQYANELQDDLDTLWDVQGRWWVVPIDALETRVEQLRQRAK